MDLKTDQLRMLLSQHAMRLGNIVWHSPKDILEEVHLILEIARELNERPQDERLVNRAS